MRVLSWPSRIFWLTAACCLLIYAAGLAGRSVTATIVAGRDRNSAVSPMDVLLIDYSRGLSIERRLTTPYAIRADWETHPPQVLIRLVGSDAVIFRLSQLDFASLRLQTLVTHRVPISPRPRDLEVAFAGQRAAIYSPAAGEVSLIGEGTSTGQAVNVTENSNEMIMAWSPDGDLLAVKDYRSAQLALLDGASVRLIGTFRDAAPVWLPDGRSILLAQDTFVGRNGRIRLIDAASGETQPYTADLAGRSAATCGGGLLGYIYIQPEGTVTVRTLDLTTGETKAVFDRVLVESQDIFALTFAPREACDWLLMAVRRLNESNSLLYRLHIPSGDLSYLGDNARILELTADAVIYESTKAGVTFMVQRAAFEVGAAPEIFGQIPAQNEPILWLDGFRHGLFLRSGQLWSVDLTTGTAPILAVPARLQDMQLVTQE
jgi:hypothetical protein